MAELPPLASIDDVEALLGHDLTQSEITQAEALLNQASGLFRRTAHRSFTAGEGTFRLKVNGGEVRLPESPVVRVDSVKDDEGNDVTYTLFDATITTSLQSHRFVRVTYAYGATEVPALVVTTVAGMVARVMNVDPRARAGLAQVQETAGPYSAGGTFAGWAVGAQLLLSPADAEVAKMFRATRLSNTIVLGAR